MSWADLFEQGKDTERDVTIAEIRESLERRRADG